MAALTVSRGQALAAVWFGLAAGLAAGLVAATSPEIDRASLVDPVLAFLVVRVLPFVLGTVAGYLFGAAILDPAKTRGGRWAAVRGICVALLAYAAYLPAVSLWLIVILSGGTLPDLVEVLLVLIGVLLYSTWGAWIVLLVGAAAGVSLFLLRGRLGAPPA